MRRLNLIAWTSLFLFFGPGQGYADSAIPLISGFDLARIDAAYPPSDEATIGELAKLVYRLRSLDVDAIERLVSAQGGTSLGDACKVDGTVEGRVLLEIPTELVEFLEFKRLHIVDIRSDQRSARIIASDLPAEVQVGDRIQAVGVIIEALSESDEATPSSLALVSGNMRWFPKTFRNDGQQLLSANGLDLGLLSSIASRSRRPLLAEDGDAFYSMLAVAGMIGDQPNRLQPSRADPVAILRDPKDLGGQWMHMDLETVQVTRIVVNESHRQEQLGSDHYYQIDAVGDLGNVLIRIESPEEGGSPATFRNRYPVSLVVRQLPAFLQTRIKAQAGGDAVVSQIRVKIGVDGFFFRLWGYETDFMNQRGGGQQFGPLLIAARLQNQEPASSDPVGVGVIGTVAAVVILSAVLLIWWWQRRAWAGDDAARRRRQEHQSDRVQLPQ